MEDNLEKQLIPYLEPIINQTLEMIEGMLGEGNLDEGEINELLYKLEEEFGEYMSMLSPQIHGKILKIHDKLLNSDDVHESINL